MIRLVVRRGLSQGASFESDAELIRLGRAESNDLIVKDQHVSGEHASIVDSGQGWVLRDHHSTNGTRILRGSQVIDLATEPGREYLLAHTDQIQLGEPGESAALVEVVVDEEDDDGASIVSERDVEAIREQEQRVDRELLQQLYEASKRLTEALDLEEVIDAVAQEVFRFLTRATHVTVALREAAEDGRRQSARYVPLGTRVRGEGTPSDAIPITRSVFKRVVKRRTAVLAADAKAEVGETASMMAAQILSTIGVPLWSGEEIIGVLQVDNRASEGLFREGDLDVLALLAQAASQAFSRAQLIHRLKDAERRQRTENVYLKRREERRRFDGIIGESPAMKHVFEQLRRVVDTRVTVLIEGETGTGKELVASAVHYWSNRRDKLFVAQNCAALPENLLESELFGHRKGAFTGATEDKKGLFELCHEGTLFLDEVGEMPLPLQAKLLRVLQEGELRPVGSNRTRKVDVRIVAATNRDLEKEVAENRFREDLFYRLKVFPLCLPPLRERREDVALLARHFLARYGREFGRDVEGFSQEAMELLLAYDWPGNVRELENEVQRLVIQMDEESFVAPKHLSERVRAAQPVSGAHLALSGGSLQRIGTLKHTMEELEKQLLRDALEEHENNKSATAETLGITREGLHKKLKKYGMS